MADPRGFLNTGREVPKRRPVDVRIRDWREVYEEQEFSSLQKQAGRCMDCGIPFCHQGCPLGNLIPSLVNTEMVDVLSIPKDQEEKLKSILSRFHAETGSLIAHELLGDWQAALKRFSLVMPRDYAKVLAVIDKAEREGKSADDAIMEALNG